jgi:AcrR family transcriptional regulator
MLAARSRRGRTNSRGDATREQILEAAVELLGEMGYAGLSISAVCDRADVAPTAIYWHFGNKAGLMEAVIARIGGSSDRILAEVAAAEPAERLDRLIAEIRALVTTQPLGSLTGVAIVGEGRHVTPEEAVAAGFAAALGAEHAAGETLAGLVLACTNYAALWYRIDHDVDEVDRILAGLRAAIVGLARAESA